MSRNSTETHLTSMTDKAEQLRLNLEAAIESGDEAEVDAISQLYEAALESVFSFESKTQSCVITKLDFAKRVLLIDHPIPTLVERAFESLSLDMRHLIAR